MRPRAGVGRRKPAPLTQCDLANHGGGRVALLNRNLEVFGARGWDFFHDRANRANLRPFSVGQIDDQFGAGDLSGGGVLHLANQPRAVYPGFMPANTIDSRNARIRFMVMPPERLPFASIAWGPRGD